MTVFMIGDIDLDTATSALNKSFRTLEWGKPVGNKADRKHGVDRSASYPD